MPNQLATEKVRKTLTEHKAVLAALAEIAKEKQISIMDLMRKALRTTISNHVENPSCKKDIQKLVLRYAPKPPDQSLTPARLSRFKQKQREFDSLMIELQLSNPKSIEKHNSIIHPDSKIKIMEFE